MKIFKNMAPTRIIALGFLLVIGFGTLLLMLPFSSKSGEFTNFTDCLFTAASATCVTGLSTVVTSEHWSIIGQFVILAMIQIGGLGFMAFVTLFFVILGKKITMRNRLIIKESYNLDERKGGVKFVKLICKFTFIMELLGALLLSIRFIPKFGFTKGVYYSIFHSVSAFCNAGFDLFGSNSFIEYSGDWLLCVTIILLIIIGGIGFPVAMDLYVFYKNFRTNKFKLKKCAELLKLHSKIVIITTAVLIVFGALFFIVAEYNNPNTLGNMSISHKILAATFQSVTLRTAGFVTIDQSGLTFSSKFISILYMLAGGSPASTAGGVKTVTIAVIILSVISLLKGQEDITVFKRTISPHTVRKAMAVLIIMLITAFISVLILSVTEDCSSYNATGMDIFYEVFSAIDTVGVTTGLTPNLTNIGKLLITLCMYIGRIGPITMSMIFISGGNDVYKRYPEGKVIVG